MRMEEEDEEEQIANVFDIRDFTCVSPLEILSRELELIIRKWQGHFLAEEDPLAGSSRDDDERKER